MASTDDLVSTQKGGVQNLGKLAQYWQQFVAPGQTLSSTASPKATIYTTLATSSVQIIASSSLRRGIVFFNPNPSGVNAWVVPANVSAAVNQGILITPGNSFSVAASLASNTAWNAIAASGVNNIITILEFF